MLCTKGFKVFGICLLVSFLACGGSDSSSSSSGGGKGKVATIKGALKNAQGKKVAVGAKSKSGKVYKAKIDPKSDMFVLNVPKSEKIALSVNVGGQVKPLKFIKHKPVQSGNNKGSAISSLVSEVNIGEVFDLDFLMKLDVDLGNIDLMDPELIIGDEEDEISIMKYMDYDGDKDNDWEDDKIDLDGDGTMDWEDPDLDIDIDGDGEDDWEDANDTWDDFADDEQDWVSFYDEEDMCGLDDTQCGVPDEYIDEEGNPYDEEDDNGNTEEDDDNTDENNGNTEEDDESDDEK